MHGSALSVLEVTNYIQGSIENPEDSIRTQSITITARNPTNARSATVKLVGEDYTELTGWEILGIALAGIVLVVALGVLGRWAVKKIRAYRKMVPASEKGLME